MNGVPQEGPLVEIVDLHKHYRLARERLMSAPRTVHALRGVSLTVERGRNLGVVGESGCGKSTLARAIMGLERPSQGRLRIMGHDLHALRPTQLRPLRRHFQMVFQDPFGSLDPRHTVARLVAEPLALEEVNASNARSRVQQMLDAVGLRPTDMDKYPHEFSGGQRQRIAIARALVTRPALIVADEPVSALDVSVQAQVLNLLADLGDAFGVTYVLISHDFAIVEYLCEEVIVMHEGSIVERGTADAIFASPQHAYTRALLDAVPPIPAVNLTRAEV
ncbi:MAG: ATP-binding cassette domain-containing protein [Gammaproteobacteria bacterium]